MATVDNARVSTALSTIISEVADQVNRSVVLLQLLPYAPAVGQTLNWDADFAAAGEATDSSLADGSDVTVFEDDDLVPASLGYASYSQGIKLTAKAMAAARASRDPAQLRDLFGEKLMRAVHRLTKNLGTDIYTGTGSNRLLGLLATAGGLSATGTYANIDRATYTAWASNVLANGGVPRANSFQLMRDMRRTIYTASGETPDLIICDPTQHEKYGLLFNDQRRYVQEIVLRGQRITLDGGYKALEFDGIPVIQDVRCPSGKMLFLNTKHTWMRQLPVDQDIIPGSASVQLQGTAEEQFGAASTRLTFTLHPLGRGGAAAGFQLFGFPQIQVKRPNCCGVLADLS